MSHIVIVRAYQLGDEMTCKELLRDSVNSSMGIAFRTMMFNEITFQLMILLAAIMFIFFGVPLTICLLVIPVVIVLMYMGTYMTIALRVARLNQEDISRAYMSNPFSCFWIAEAFEPYLMTQDPRKTHYTVLTEKEFRYMNIGVSLQARKIVGTIGLCKSHSLDRGAWLKRFCVHGMYMESDVAECLFRTAIEFAIDQGYSCVNIQMPGYDEKNREMCLKAGFEFKQMFHKGIVGSLVTLLMYELTYQIWRHQSDKNSHALCDEKDSLNMY